MTSAAARDPWTEPDTAPPTLIRLNGPGDIAAAVPSLCGFVPHESLVVLSLRGARRRLGLTMRVDLPEVRDEATVVDVLLERLLEDGAEQAAVVVMSDVGRREVLLHSLIDTLSEHGVDTLEALHVSAGRWSSYVCLAACCPAGGTPVAASRSRASELLAAEHVLSGRSVLGSRQALEASVAPPVLLAERAAQQQMDAALQVWLRERAERGEQAVNDERRALARQALLAVRDGGRLDAAGACALSVSWTDVRLRDEVATWALGEGEALQALLLQVVRHLPAGEDAPACTLLAWVAYARGEGALANVALDRALLLTPGYSLAQLLRTMLDSAVPPSVLRDQLGQLAGGRRA